MKGPNHLVLDGHDLDAMRNAYAGLGFTLTPQAQHPFGTGNIVIQLHGCYLELLSVTKPEAIVEHAGEHFSFSAYNRDYLARHEGFGMLVLGTDDAAADRAAWTRAALQTYAPFEFARPARLPSGEEVTLGFALAFVSHPQAPWLGLFSCQHFRPDYYEQPHFLQHRNGAKRVRDVWIVADRPEDLLAYIGTVMGGASTIDAAGNHVFPTATGDVVVASEAAFADAFGWPAANAGDGPRLAGFTVGCKDTALIETLGLVRVGERHVVAPERNFGTAMAFAKD